MPLKLVPRGQIFELNQTLAHYIYQWQLATFDPSIDRFEPGDEVWLETDDEQATVISEEKAEELNRDYEEYCISMRDDFDPVPQEKNYTGSIIAELPSQNFESFTTIVGTKFRDFAKEMGWNEFLVISDAKAEYLHQDNTFSPVQNAQTQLMNLGLTKEYSGGIIIDHETIEPFLTSIFWIVRCNAATPNISITAKDAPIIATLCKYGNFHFECYDKAEEKKLEEALLSTGFAIAEDGVCMEHFSDDGIIEGRRIPLE